MQLDWMRLDAKSHFFGSPVRFIDFRKGRMCCYTAKKIQIQCLRYYVVTSVTELTQMNKW